MASVMTNPHLARPPIAALDVATPETWVEADFYVVLSFIS
jgi:hypothetical protein